MERRKKEDDGMSGKRRWSLSSCLLSILQALELGHSLSANLHSILSSLPGQMPEVSLA